MPAHADHLGSRGTLAVMALPVIIALLVGGVVWALAGFVAGLVALLIAGGMGIAFNPVMWAGANRVAEREKIEHAHPAPPR